MQIKYVGVKLDGETAFTPATGIVWYPGSSEDVPQAIAIKMLQHPDVFERDTEKPSLVPTAPVKPAPAAKQDPVGGLEHDDTLLGSDVLPAVVYVNGSQVGLGTIVAAAFERSTLTAAAWNSLPATEREELLAREITSETAGNPSPASTSIQLPNRAIVSLDALDIEKLKALAAELGIKHHVNAGVKSITAKLVEAFPVAR